MANKVIAGVVGGEESLYNGVSTVGELKKKIGESVKNYSATVNGEPADESYTLEDRDFVSFAPQVKAANK